MNKKKLTTLSHTEQVKVTLTSDQLKHLENLLHKFGGPLTGVNLDGNRCTWV